MSTSLLYHCFGIRGYRYVRAEYLEGEVVFTIKQNRHTLQCPLCGSHEVIAAGNCHRLFRGLPIGSKGTRIAFDIPLVGSRQICGVTRQVAVPFADPQKHFTQAFERYALELSRHMTIQDVAHHLTRNLGHHKDIQKRDLQRHYSKPRLETYNDVVRLVDEIRAGGHPCIEAGASIDLFGYSIGAFLAEIIMLSNPGRDFGIPRAFLFCGGSTLGEMTPVSKYILDGKAGAALSTYFRQRFEEELSRESPLARLFASPVPRNDLPQPPGPGADEGIPEGSLGAIGRRIRALALARDGVVRVSKSSVRLRRAHRRPVRGYR